jgi:membrane protein YdbS with pleckstrin-like domain
VRFAVVSPVIVVIWLIIGAIAAGQRGYFNQSDPDCGSLGSTAVTILVGPLNYIGVNPEIECPDMPEPS